MTVNSAQVTVTTSATQLDPVVDPMRKYSLLVRNVGPADVWVGGASVTTSNGCKFGVGEDLSITVGASEVVYGIVASGTTVCHVLKVGGPE